MLVCRLRSTENWILRKCLMENSWFDSGYMFMRQVGRSSWVLREGGFWILRRVLSVRDARTWKTDIFLRALVFGENVASGVHEIWILLEMTSGDDPHSALYLVRQGDTYIRQPTVGFENFHIFPRVDFGSGGRLSSCARALFFFYKKKAPVHRYRAGDMSTGTWFPELDCKRAAIWIYMSL